MDNVTPQAASIGAQATAVVLGTFLSGTLYRSLVTRLFVHLHVSGTMTGLALIMVPVLLDVNADTRHLLRQWVCLYNYGHRVLPAISIATLLIYGYVVYDKWTDDGGAWMSYGLAGLLTVGIIPFTLVVMLSSNNLLFQLEADIHSDPKATTLRDAQSLVAKWSRMHLIRSMFPLAGAVLGFSALLREVSV